MTMIIRDANTSCDNQKFKRRRRKNTCNFKRMRRRGRLASKYFLISQTPRNRSVYSNVAKQIFIAFENASAAFLHYEHVWEFV